jgi:hypothetical protein
MQDLGTLGGGNSYGQASNDDGQILAEGFVDATGANAAFLLNPISSVPLPAAAWLLISGLGGLARLRKSAPTART